MDGAVEVDASLAAVDGAPDATMDSGLDVDSGSSDGTADLDASSTTDSGDGGVADSGLTLISTATTSLFEGETEIAMAPDGTLAAAWISNTPGSAVIGYAFSPDRGRSWGHVAQVEARPMEFASDPAVTVDGQGNFYLAWLSLTNNATFVPAHVLVAKAPQGSLRFGPAVEASDPALNTTYDHPKITVTRGGTIAVSVLQISDLATDFGNGLVLRSQAGQSWRRSVFLPIDPNAFSNLFYPCTPKTSGDRLYITYFRATAAGTEIDLTWSDDGGSSWSPSVMVSMPGESVAGGDPACGAYGSDLYVSYGTSTIAPDTSGLHLPLLTGIRVAHSGDRGAHFDARWDAADTTVAAHFLLPKIAVTDLGTVDLVYYAGRHDGVVNGTFRGSRLISGAWSPSRSLSPPLLFTTRRDAVTWLGDYVGIASNNGSLVATYVYNAHGVSHVAFGQATFP
jgi:hypothetical protein